jgi:hypothetical protein
LDKTAKQGKEVTQPSKWPEFNVKISPERFSEYQARFNEAVQESKAVKVNLDKGLKSYWARGQIFAEGMKHIQIQDLADEVSFMTTFYALDYIETRLSNIEKIVEGITKLRDIDLPELKNQIMALQQTIAQPEIAEVSKFIRDTYAMMEKAKKKAREAQDKIVS